MSTTRGKGIHASSSDYDDVFGMLQAEESLTVTFSKSYWLWFRLLVRFGAQFSASNLKLPAFLPQVVHSSRLLEKLTSKLEHPEEIHTIAMFLRGFCRTPEEAAGLMHQYVHELTLAVYQKYTPEQCVAACKAYCLRLDGELAKISEKRTTHATIDPDSTVLRMYEKWLHSMPSSGALAPVESQGTSVVQKGVEFLKKTWGVVQKYGPLVEPFVPGIVGKGLRAIDAATEQRLLDPAPERPQLPGFDPPAPAGDGDEEKKN